jgi:NADH-quinone oxidoreductase subunit M
MNPLHLPWLDLSVLLSLLGALWVSQLRDPFRAARWGFGFTGAVFGCAVLAWLSFYVGVPAEASDPYSLQLRLCGRKFLWLDELSAPLVPAVALLHFLTALATARTKMRRFSFSWSLAAQSIRLATFSCVDLSLLVSLLAISTVPPYVELMNRGKPTRVYSVHMGLFVGLLLAGWGLAQAHGSFTTAAIVFLAAAMLVRCGTVPVHCWITDWFENASFGNALLYVAPLTGIYVALRFVLPVAPDWILSVIGVMSLLTAVYAAGMAVVQREARRFFAYLFLSHASLVLVGMELHTAISLTGSLCLWFSSILALGGLGLTLRALEARFGRLSLADHHGLYEHVPTLGVCFLLTGLASVGFPFTLGFVSTELLVDGAIEASLYVGIGVIAAAALNGIALVRCYFMIFTGKRHASTISLGIGWREQLALLTLAVLILGGGLFPQAGISSRHTAAVQILNERKMGQATGYAETTPPNLE